MSEEVDKRIVTYFKGWPKINNLYVQDLIWAMKVGMQYIDRIKNRPSTKPRCMVFDFDDCLVFGDPKSVVGVREMELGEHDGSDIFELPRNEPIVKLAEYAKSNGIMIIILTARPKESRQATLWNCRDFKIPYDAIIMNDNNKDPCFKVDVRRRVAAKYDVCLTIGDQITDVLSPGGKTAFIKLPDPDSLASYAWIPPE